MDEESAPPEQDEEPGRVLVEEPPPPAPPSSGRRPLRRRSSGKVIAGVAGGLADYLGVSANIPRAVFGTAAFVVGFLLLRPWIGMPYGSAYYDPNLAGLRGLVKLGSALAVIGYLALWVFVPSEDRFVSAAASTAARFRGRLRFGWTRSWLAMLALVAGASLLGSYLGLWSPDVVWAFLLIGTGVVLFRRDAERASTGPARTVVVPGASAQMPVVPQVLTVPLPGPLPLPPRERSPLGWIALGIALLVVGGAAIAQNLGGVSLRPVRFPALGLLVIGIGLLVGTFVGRARWLILPCLVLMPLTLAFSVVTVPLQGGIGDLSVSPVSIGSIPGGFGETSDGYRRIVGGINVDMTNFRCEPGPVHVNASTAFGDIQLYVPFDAHVNVVGSAGSGALYLGSVDARGFDVRRQVRLEPRFGDGASIVANLATGIGNVDVYRERLSKHQREKACR